MILQLNEDTTSIGIRIKSWRNQRYIGDWQGLVLGIMPGERGCHDHDCCHTGGSPWYVWGCWPGHRTGVDLMNPRKPDFPAFFIHASAIDNLLVIFNLPERWRQTVPFGRYTGFVRYQPEQMAFDPINSRTNFGLVKPAVTDPGCYQTPPESCSCQGYEPHPGPCVLAEFDVDYGPRCSQHIIDRIDMELGDG